MVIKYDVSVLSYELKENGDCTGEVDHSQYFTDFLDAVAWGISKLIPGASRSFGVYATGIHNDTVWFSDKELCHYVRTPDSDIVKFR